MALLKKSERRFTAHHGSGRLQGGLAVSDRLVRFWAADDREVPTSVMPKLLELLRDRGGTIESTMVLVERYMNKDL